MDVMDWIDGEGTVGLYGCIGGSSIDRRKRRTWIAAERTVWGFGFVGAPTG